MNTFHLAARVDSASTKQGLAINQFWEDVDAWVVVHDHPDEQSGRGIACLRGLLLLIYQNSLFDRSIFGRLGCLCLGP